MSLIELNRLSLNDKSLFEEFLALGRHTLSSYSFANIYIWRALFGIYWSVTEGALLVFFEDKGSIFMYLGPLTNKLSLEAVERAFSIMNSINKNREYSRIENVEKKDLLFYQSLGYKHNEKSRDYICRQDSLARLNGNALKSKRSARNYFLKHNNFECLPFAGQYKKDCIYLYEEWMSARRAVSDDYVYRGMLDDNFAALKELLDNYKELGVTGKVILIDGILKAFTFGFPIGRNMFCIAYEVTDLSVKGLSNFIFYSFSKELKNYKYINIMDDSGVDKLKKAKLSYCPSKFAVSYTIKK